MPRNASVISLSPTQLVLRADPPPKTGGLPVNSWRVQYFVVDKEENLKSARFDNGKIMHKFF